MRNGTWNFDLYHCFLMDVTLLIFCLGYPYRVVWRRKFRFGVKFSRESGLWWNMGKNLSGKCSSMDRLISVYWSRWFMVNWLVGPRKGSFRRSYSRYYRRKWRWTFRWYIRPHSSDWTSSLRNNSLGRNQRGNYYVRFSNPVTKMIYVNEYLVSWLYIIIFGCFSVDCFVFKFGYEKRKINRSIRKW